ncbi:hypothetical protein NQ317_013724 [Molorchus minor]|uniref:Uncharacterized protein n=1 Tax=Molorchus minor TaxID=1323400 RepID=A0ABQ9JP02_9CUCU|nr:hypothetical protein NQ317_013724 [Molorchus minor]
MYQISPLKKESNESSEDTNIYSDPETEKQNHHHHYVELPSMDENPILNSIIRNLETSPEPIKSLHYNLPSNPYDLDQPTCSKTQDEDNILMSIIDDTHSTSTDTPLDYETQVSYKKEEIMSQIFQDGPCTSKNLPKNDEGSDGVGVKKGKSDTIDDILKETEELLKE